MAAGMADHKMDTSFLEEVKKEAADAVIELLTQAKLEEGDILVVGCSSSEVVGERIGTFSSVETAQAVFTQTRCFPYSALTPRAASFWSPTAVFPITYLTRRTRKPCRLCAKPW